jgi:hypothetical protein
MNLDITPARVIYRHAPFLVKSKYSLGDMKFNSAKIVNSLATQRTGEAVLIDECRDIPEGELIQPYFRGNLIEFSAPLSFSDYLTIKNNPYGLVEVYSPFDKTFVYGWIKEISFEANSKATNWTLIEKVRATPTGDSWEWVSGDNITWNSAGDIYLNY